MRVIVMANKPSKERKEKVIKKKDKEESVTVSDPVEMEVKEIKPKLKSLDPLVLKLLKDYISLIAKNVPAIPSNRIKATHTLFRLLSYTENLSDREKAAVTNEINKVIKVSVLFSEEVLKRKHDLTVLSETHYNELMKMTLNLLA